MKNLKDCAGVIFVAFRQFMCKMEHNVGLCLPYLHNTYFGLKLTTNN